MRTAIIMVAMALWDIHAAISKNEHKSSFLKLMGWIFIIAIIMDIIEFVVTIF